MMIDTNKPKCPNCGGEIIQMTNPVVIEDTPDGIVVECTGYCCHEWYKWYEHYGYKGHLGLEKTSRICARG